jgi:tripartite-type tricarboxylate transporter receptor subunit TctC
MPTRRHLIASAAASVVAPGLICSARASDWPDRTVHLVVPLAAGGPTDVNARVVAEQLGKIWGQQVVIDNKAGAGTNIGNAFVAHSDPDGYTLLFGTSSLASNGALYRSHLIGKRKAILRVSKRPSAFAGFDVDHKLTLRWKK